jgi:hypothetical protein
MKPTEIIRVEVGSNSYGKQYFWTCNNNVTYETKEIAAIIGTSSQNLINKFKFHGLVNDKLFKPSVKIAKKKTKAEKEAEEAKENKVKPIDHGSPLCNVGDRVEHRGEVVDVAQVVFQGTESTKSAQWQRAEVRVCRILSNGQVLRRSPRYIGTDWRHL